MDFLYFILLCTAMQVSTADDLCRNDQYKRIHRVDPSRFVSRTISSNTGIRNRVRCAEHCMSEEDCVSFSYTEVTKTCDTYYRFITKDTNAAVSYSTMFFSSPTQCSGIYDYTTTSGVSLEVFKDFETENGPWIVIQRREKVDVDFYRNWKDYTDGFGDLLGDFWMGNDALYLLTRVTMTLRIEIEAWDGTKGYAQYETFRVADEAQNYQLFIQGYRGNLQNELLEYNNNQYFTTFDNDNDLYPTGNCANGLHGAWWDESCGSTNLNGRYMQDDGIPHSDSMCVMNLPSSFVGLPLKKSKMMIR